MRRAALLLAWLAGLAGLAWLVQARLVVDGDLRLFMPAPQSTEERLLLQQFGEGPGARLLLLALSGADTERLAAVSHDLRSALAGDPRFTLVANGGEEGGAISEELLPWRYLLTPARDQQPLDAGTLRQALERRLRDLASPAAPLVEPWVARDPTLEVLALLEHWQPVQEPQRLHDAWFSRDGAQALLLAQTRAPGFDPDAQAGALAAIHAAFAQARERQAATDAQLSATGPGAFSVLMRERTRAEATWLGGAATLGMVLLLGFAYRSWQAPLLCALPLASAALAGLAAVAAAFGSVHGITIAFGVTLIGVAQDYPVHLLSHHRPDRTAWTSVRALWPTLATGAASTCIAYLSFFVAGVAGLAQLAVFTIAGLATAALATRWLLPALLAPARRDPGGARLLARGARWLAHAPRPRRAAGTLALAAAASLLLVPGPWWENRLAALVPVPEPLLAQDRSLRAELGAPDLRYLLVLEADSFEQLLQRCERLVPALQGQVAGGALSSFDLPCRYLPSEHLQRQRQARLPDAASLQGALAQATAGLPFRAGVFRPFLADVAAAREAAPLRQDDLEGTPLEQRLQALLLDDGTRPAALVTLAGVREVAALRQLADEQGPGIRLLDLRAASESLAAAYRERVLLALAGALLLLALVVWAALRSLRRSLRVLVPMLLSTLLVVALLHGAGVALTLFHLVALILSAGLGLDYALFVDHAGHDPAGQRRTLHALAVCSASTLLVFGLLALSQIPVLHALGLTVALGVGCNLVLALALARPPPGDRGR